MKGKEVVGVAKGWDKIQPGKPMCQFCDQVVKDHPQALKRKGNPQAFEHDESLQGNKAQCGVCLVTEIGHGCFMPECNGDPHR